MQILVPSPKFFVFGYPNFDVLWHSLESSEYFGTSIFRFSILELVEVELHIACVEGEKIDDFALTS